MISFLFFGSKYTLIPMVILSLARGLLLHILFNFHMLTALPWVTPCSAEVWMQSGF